MGIGKRLCFRVLGWKIKFISTDSADEDSTINKRILNPDREKTV